MEFPNLKDELNGFIRVIKIARRPTKDEFLKVIKLTGVGMLIIGTIGLIITVISMVIGL